MCSIPEAAVYFLYDLEEVTQPIPCLRFPICKMQGKVALRDSQKGISIHRQLPTLSGVMNGLQVWVQKDMGVCLQQQK